MVCRTSEQTGSSNAGSSMWTVVVLGLITAVFAWVWFGGRGEKKGSEAGQRSVSAHTLQETRPNSEDPHSQDTAPTPSGAPTEESQESEDTPNNETQHPAKEANCSEKGNELNSIESNAREGQENGVHGPDEILSDKSCTMEEQITLMDLKDLAGEGIVLNSKEAVCHFDAPTKEVQIRQDPLEDLALIKNVHDLRSSAELVGVQEEVYPSVGNEGMQVTVEDLKPSVVPKEKLVQTSEVRDFIAQDKVVPIGVEAVTDLTQQVHVQDDDVGKLINGSEAHVQEENDTGNLINVNLLSDTVSPKQVHRSDREKVDQNECKSFEQSLKIDLAGDNHPSATLESAACAQVNGDMAQTNNASSETCHAALFVPQNLEDDVMLTSQTSPTVDEYSVLNQEKESLYFQGSSFGDNRCFAIQPEAKVYDVDSQRAKRVAAVQPIPQNVSLGFRVHYITHSDSQIIAVIGDHEKLGEWENHVPLTSDKDGYWSHSVTLPADATIEWKFVMVENGKIKRWEECNNRHLRTAHEDIPTQQWWGYP